MLLEDGGRQLECEFIGTQKVRSPDQVERTRAETARSGSSLGTLAFVEVRLRGDELN
jgi:hypothetical protein